MGEDTRARFRALVRRFDSDVRIHRVTRAVRRLLPGDDDFGDPLSTAGRGAPQRLGRELRTVASLGGDPAPSALRELGLSALQVWSAVVPSGRAVPVDRATILFTDLAGFSGWSLDVGDRVALDYLRAMGAHTEPLIGAADGRVVKRLGDGLMAVFPDPRRAVETALEMRDRVEVLRVDGHRLQLRAGLHQGRPLRLGSDLFGVDVNVAARIAEAARPGEVLASNGVVDLLPPGTARTRRRLFFRAKGVPDGVRVSAVEWPSAVGPRRMPT